MNVGELLLIRYEQDVDSVDVKYKETHTHRIPLPLSDNYVELASSEDEDKRLEAEKDKAHAEYLQAQAVLQALVNYSVPDCHWYLAGQNEHTEFLIKDMLFTMGHIDFER